MQSSLWAEFLGELARVARGVQRNASVEKAENEKMVFVLVCGKYIFSYLSSICVRKSSSALRLKRECDQWPGAAWILTQSSYRAVLYQVPLPPPAAQHPSPLDTTPAARRVFAKSLRNCWQVTGSLSSLHLPDRGLKSVDKVCVSRCKTDAGCTTALATINSTKYTADEPRRMPSWCLVPGHWNLSSTLRGTCWGHSGRLGTRHRTNGALGTAGRPDISRVQHRIARIAIVAEEKYLRRGFQQVCPHFWQPRIIHCRCCCCLLGSDTRGFESVCHLALVLDIGQRLAHDARVRLERDNFTGAWH